jgi:glyoxylase-like metal-dependent hydrolase (beta-lactamase superfamily II)
MMTTIGKINVLGIFDGTGKEPAREVLTKPGQLDPWECHSDLLDPQGNLEFAPGGFLVLAGDHKILIDTGVGTISNDKYEGGRFLESLRDQGIEPGEITDVVFTHLHFDHVGWATQKGDVVFDNATYRVHSADWKYFVESPEASPGAIRKLQPLTEHLETFDEDRELVPGLSSRHVAGHTPGSICLKVSLSDGEILFTGDHLFKGSVGRTDLPGGSTELLNQSMKEKILPLRDDLRVFPGHGETTTIGYERRTNPYLVDL